MRSRERGEGGMERERPWQRLKMKKRENGESRWRSERGSLADLRLHYLVPTLLIANHDAAL